MLIVSDTSPITNLLQIGHLDLLKQVFGQVVIPKTVYEELGELPQQQLFIDGQSWLTVLAARSQEVISSLTEELDPGEAEAIALALEIKADYLVIDELKGRHKAELLGLKIVGLLGVLIQAKQAGYIQAVEPLLIALREKAGFRIHHALYKRVLQLAVEALL
jgi:predicted nucleic acid-binding protein